MRRLRRKTNKQLFKNVCRSVAENASDKLTRLFLQQGQRNRLRQWRRRRRRDQPKVHRFILITHEYINTEWSH